MDEKESAIPSLKISIATAQVITPTMIPAMTLKTIFFTEHHPPFIALYTIAWKIIAGFEPKRCISGSAADKTWLQVRGRA
jgi:hypothetical protein